MNRRGMLTTAALALPAAGCAALSGPFKPVGPDTDAAIRTAFNITQAALVVLQFVPGIPAIVTTEAVALLKSLQEAYENYKATPPGTTSAQATLQAAIDAASAFIQNNGLPAAMATPAGRRARVKLVR
jgi:hypothetical protein